MLGLLRIDPHRLMVAVHSATGSSTPGYTAVLRDQEGDAQDVDAVNVVGRRPDLAEVVAVGIDRLADRLRVHAAPRDAGVVRAPDLDPTDVGGEKRCIRVLQRLQQVVDRNRVAAHGGDEPACIESRIDIVAADEVLDLFGVLRKEFVLAHVA